MAVVTICSDFRAQKDKSLTVSIFSPSIYQEVMGLDVMILVFWMLSFSVSSFTFIKRLFSSSFLSAIRMVSFVYLRLLIFLLAILIPACVLPSLAFRMMYSAYKVNKQGHSIHPWCTPFTICNQSIVPYPILAVVSWHAYRLLRRQVRWSGIPISFRIFQFVLIHTVKGFGIVNEAEVNVFWNSLAFSMIQHMIDLWFLCLFYIQPAWTSGNSWSCTVEAWFGEFWVLLC